MQFIKKPTAAELDAIDLSPEFERAPNNWDKHFFLGVPGREHYKLLAWIGQQLEGSFMCEIGTLWGGGTLAMALNRGNHIYTIDITPHTCSDLPENVTRIIAGKYYPWHLIAGCTVIFYDAAHEGKEEQEFLDALIAMDWHGMLIYDDIHLNPAMQKFWKSIKLEKQDWTDIGHFCGTGVLFL